MRVLSAAAASAPVTITTAYTTAFTWFDNTPPGSSAICCPRIHSTAGGTGTYADPITVAIGHSTATEELAADVRLGRGRKQQQQPGRGSDGRIFGQAWVRLQHSCRPLRIAAHDRSSLESPDPDGQRWRRISDEGHVHRYDAPTAKPLSQPNKDPYSDDPAPKANPHRHADQRSALHSNVPRIEPVRTCWSDDGGTVSAHHSGL